MDINENQVKRIERKLLSEECWIDLGDGLEIKIDYMTRSQEVEFRRLATLWELQGTSEKQHYWGYFLKSISKNIRGLTIAGKPATLEFKNGLLENIISDGNKYDYVAVLLELKKLENLYYEAYTKLVFDDVDKKKFLSVQESSKTEKTLPSEKDSREKKES
jgi:hypothetical protein